MQLWLCGGGGDSTNKHPGGEKLFLGALYSMHEVNQYRMSNVKIHQMIIHTFYWTEKIELCIWQSWEALTWKHIFEKEPAKQD